MKKVNMKSLFMSSIVCLLPIIIGLIFYKKLPEIIAIHFGIDNNPNSYISKPLFVFGLPIIMLALQIICCIVSDLSDKNKEANKKAITIYKLIIPMMTIVLYIVTIMYTLGKSVNVWKIAMTLLGIIFIIVGNYMPKIRGDYYIRTKTFFMKNKNENLINKAVKFTGYLLVIGGFLCLISIALNQFASLLVLVFIILISLLIEFYVYIESRKE